MAAATAEEAGAADLRVVAADLAAGDQAAALEGVALEAALRAAAEEADAVARGLSSPGFAPDFALH